MSYPWVRFEDGKVYHDYHFNGMQMQIAREQKAQAVEARYEARLLVHDRASYLWFDPLVNTTLIYANSGAVLNEAALTLVPQGDAASVTWFPVQLPEPASGAELTWNAVVPDGASLQFEISFDGGISWLPAGKGSWIDGTLTQSLMVRCSMTKAPNGSRPELIDLAIFW